jgi:hypothetical protein
VFPEWEGGRQQCKILFLGGAKMIGRVGSPKCKQLRGLLHTLRLKLEEAERRMPRNEKELAEIILAIENTEMKLEENGC